ncbi:fumarylacetoacetate hydrolase family protein [Microbacterium paludicola]|uniref:fumarylacetoacetate hydrolase family protein n=1 Tax=Microbacterium paludicola TaxID=300019 RepID=UPI00119F49E0|nr:fumarylacetoacetate hydrolase family protein [Microbacterium paludicola]
MRLGRVATDDGARWVREDDGRLVPVEDPFLAFAQARTPDDEQGGAVAGEVLAPVAPLVVVGIAQNGPAHESPVQAWLKSPRTVVASGQSVRLRRDAGTAVAEGEIAVVIGKPTHGLVAENAHEYVLGVTAVNDLSSPDLAQRDPRNFESKSGDGYTPLGPWIDTESGIDDIRLRVLVGDRLVADTGSSELPMPIRDCLAYVSAWSPLGPGDVVMTGAPLSQTPVEAGATVRILVGDIELVTPLA